MNRNILCFYHENEENGCFSNWYRAEFDYAREHFVSVEQFMMYHKVLMFRQFDLADKILQTDDPTMIKKLGRTHFPEFNAAIWEKTCYAIVKRGIRAKFFQNETLLKKLLNTDDNILAEASLKDTKWGIGIDIRDEKRFNPKYWTGKNYLGRILMEIRDEARISKKFDYIDAREVDFPLWHISAGTLRRDPKYYDTICAYTETLNNKHEKDYFLYQTTLVEVENAMLTNMGGGLPGIGFWELKQDVYDIYSMRK